MPSSLEAAEERRLLRVRTESEAHGQYRRSPRSDVSVAHSPMSDYRVRIEKDYTVFCAGHFITYDGHECEALHGHNYRAAAALEGPLDENAYVFDFTRLKRALKAVVDRLDHRMLLPTKSALVRVTQSGAEVQAMYRDKRYVFPLGDVVLLPIPNTTAEMLAWWIAQELRQDLEGHPRGASAIEVEVDESFGQRAFYREVLDKGGPSGPGRP
jgi:6-pyruvoyltetrahydropterin/6-carboxytetrahydropterin synthase